MSRIAAKWALGLWLALAGVSTPAWALRSQPPKLARVRTTPKVALKLGKTKLQITTAEAPKARTSEEQEHAVLKSFQRQPAKFYLKLRAEMLESAKGGKEFSYKVWEPVLDRIIADLEKHVAEAQHEDLLPSLQATLVKAKQLKVEGVPYRKSMRFVFEDYLEEVDKLYVRQYPQFAGRFHKTNAGNLLENILNKRTPDVLLFPTFAAVDLNYFAATRAAPFHIVGLDPRGTRKGEPSPYADGFFMRPSEFGWHDVDHIESMMIRDFDYIDKSFKPMERVVQEWGLTQAKVKKFWSKFRGRKNVHDAMGMLLFEILHERGFQYSASVLKNQLDTPKWVEILNRKRANNYFERWDNFNTKLFGELETARLELLRFLQDTRSESQKLHLKTYDGDKLEVRVTHSPKIEYGQSHLDHLEIRGDGGVRFFGKTDGNRLESTGTDEAILAQVTPTKNSPLTTPVLEKMSAILRSKSAKVTVTTPRGEKQVDALVIDKAGKLTLRTEDGGSFALADVTVHAAQHLGGILLTKREIFEINQVLGATEQGDKVSYTMSKPAMVYRGTVTTKLVNGVEHLRIKSSEGTIKVIPLSEALVDPLQKEDFQ